MKNNDEKIPIKKDDGTGGQNDAWPGESPTAPKPGTEEDNDRGETIHVPIVQ